MTLESMDVLRILLIHMWSPERQRIFSQPETELNRMRQGVLINIHWSSNGPLHSPENFKIIECNL